MTKVPLRAYLAEIQEAIEQKQTEEAVAHCRHILQTYPKHIETYRLLGKAYLESQRYGNAADIFQRVLSSIPDDFVSHVGMSIIREDETNLDEAIWHMKRAYESQPYNTAIQSELRRLYGRRDGTEPPKIRLTRGALARMYIKGNLYEQAIAELRAALVKDPQRPDLLVFLAISYAQSGKRNEAIETCGSVLQRLPYCIEANRLLAQLMPDTGNAEEMQICRQRIQAMDPYEAFISPQAPTADDVPNQAVSLYRLEWDGGPAVPQTSAQPEWATSIGVSMDDSDSDGGGLPDWLSTSPTDESVFDLDQTDSPSEKDENAIPDWMQDSGWGPSTGAFDESKSAFLFDEVEGEPEEAVAADIPDWLQGMAPDDAFEVAEESATAPESLAPDLPDWLDEEADGASETIIAWLDGKEKSEVSDELAFSDLDESSEEVPDWLQDLGVAVGTAGVAGVAKSTILPDSGETEDDEIPDWFQDLGEDASLAEEIEPAAEAELEAEAAEIPDWLRDLDKDLAPTQEVGLIAEDELEAVAAEIPDWLQDLGEEASPTGEIEPAAEEELEAVAAEIPDWLQDLGEDASYPEEIEPAAEAELEAETAEIPDWLRDLDKDLAPTQEVGLIAEDELEAVAAEIPDWLQDMGEEASPAEEIEPAAEEELEAVAAEIPDWLQNLGEEASPAEEIEPAAEEELEAVAVDIPDWLQDLGEEASYLEEIEPAAEAELEAEAAEIPDWLRDLDKDLAPTQEVELITEEKPEAEMAEIPDWLQDLGEEASPAEEIEPAAEEELEAVAVDIPDWLQDMGEEASPAEEIEPAAEAELEAEAAEIPDWLQGVGVDDAPISEPTGVTSWLKSISNEEGPIEDLAHGVEEEIETEAAEIPDWLQDLGEDAPPAEKAEPAAEEELEAVAAEIPEWLQAFSEIEAFPEEAEPAAEEELEAEAAEIPEWLQAFGDGEAPTLDEEPVVVDDTILEMDEKINSQDLPPEVVDEFDAAMAWLESLAAKQGVSEEELLTSPEERSETPPEWIKNAGVESSEVEDEFPEWLAEIGVDETEIQEPDLEDRGTGELIDASAAIAWLEGLDLSEDREAEEPAQGAEAEFPEWLNQPEPVEGAETIETPEAEKEAEDRFDKKVETEFQFDDSDSALAWLEGLAAKQGVSEDELLSSPEDRSETPPDWVQDMARDKPSTAVTAPLDQIENIEPDYDLPDLPDESAFLTDETVEAQIKQEPEADISPTEIIEEPFGELFQSLEEEAPVPEDETSEFDFTDADAAMAWLEGLAAKQGVDEGELLTSPDERSETPPEWVQDLAKEAGTQAELPAEVDSEPEEFEETETQEIPAWLKESIAVADFVDEADTEEDFEPEPDLESIPEDIPNWLRDTILGEAVSVKDLALEVEPEISQPEVVEPPAELIVEETVQEPVAESPLDETEPLATESDAPLEAESSPEDEIKPPSWVTDEEAPDDDEYTWLTPDVIDELAETSDALLNINQASLIQLERLPGMGFIRAQAVINYRNEHGEFNKLEDLLNVPEFDTETLGSIRNYVMVAVTTPKKPASKPGTGPLIMPITTEKPEDQFHAQQIEAQIKLAEGDIDGALVQYGRLIKKGKRLDGIIEDLNQALYQVPMDVSVSVLQTLGDACMRAGKLQDALDMYTKAEELLR